MVTKSIRENVADGRQRAAIQALPDVMATDVSAWTTSAQTPPFSSATRTAASWARTAPAAPCSARRRKRIRRRSSAVGTEARTTSGTEISMTRMTLAAAGAPSRLARSGAPAKSAPPRIAAAVSESQ